MIHIDAPQHHYEDEEDQRTGAVPKFVDDEKLEAFDLLELCSQIEEIRSALQVDRFLAFGVGAACNIWTYYAMNYSHRLRGMVLLNPVGCGISWREWIFEKMLYSMGTKSQFLMDSFTSSMLTRYFPRAVAEEIYTYFAKEMARLHQPSVIKYFRGFIRRMEFTEQHLKKVYLRVSMWCISV